MAFLHFDEPGSGLTALSRIETRIFHSEQEFHGDTSWWTFSLVFGWQDVTYGLPDSPCNTGDLVE